MPINYSQSVLICVAARFIARRIAGFCEKSHQLVKKMGLSTAPWIQARQRTELFIGTHDEALSVAAMCVSNEDCLPG
jgi:hypothetical protein